MADINRVQNSIPTSRHRRDIRLREQNDKYRTQNLPFIIPSSFYNVVHVHRYTSIETVSMLIDHFELCDKYSIDTEADRSTYELSLIQVHSISHHLPSFVILFEIKHFPSSNSALSSKINLLFQVLFRLGNIIFSWGSLARELQDAVKMNLFTWPVSASLVNLQNAFSDWYLRAQPSCKVHCPGNVSNGLMLAKPSCSCLHNSPYQDPHSKWSLQNAICFTIDRFLDKSHTKKHWGILLDPMYSSLSLQEQQQRINYAVYDCLAVTLLHQAICENWSITKLGEIELSKLFISNGQYTCSMLSSSISLKNALENTITSTTRSSTAQKVQHPTSLSLPTFLDDISDNDEEDDEIYLSSINLPSNIKSTACLDPPVEHRLITTAPCDVLELTAPPDDFIECTSTHEQSVPVELDKPRTTCRSISARRRRNRKRNQIKRLHRDRHIILRSIYYRFTIRQIKNILYQRNVRYIHLTINKSSNTLSIGMKNPSLVDLYFDKIPGDLFDKEHYYRYREHEH